jgi:3-oxoacyl-[acyl-carrier-protein] synthase-3
VKASGFKNVGKVVEGLTGIKSRRYDSPDRFPSDLAADASIKALKNAGIDAKDLDVIIFFGISRDFDEPATANVLQEKIGARNSYAFDIANACNGFVSAVDMLDSLIASGRCETGLVATGELISPYIDWAPKSKEDFKKTIFSYTICDAGGAAVLTRVNRGEDRGICARWFLNDGNHWRLAIAGAMEEAKPYGKFFKSKGLELEQASIERMPEGIKEVLGLLRWTVEDVDLVIPHQIPISIQRNLYEKALNLPEDKLFWTFPKYGNNATASMPVAVCEAMEQGRLKQGDKVLLLGAAAGFSGGIVGLVF